MFNDLLFTEILYPQILLLNRTKYIPAGLGYKRLSAIAFVVVSITIRTCTCLFRAHTDVQEWD